jgi:hypothetical protein
MKYVVGTMKWNKNVETGNMRVMEVATESNVYAPFDSLELLECMD